MDPVGWASLGAAVSSAIAASSALALAAMVYRRDRRTRTLDVIRDFIHRVIPLCAVTAQRLSNEQSPNPKLFTIEEAKGFGLGMHADFFARDAESVLQRKIALSALEMFALEVTTGKVDQKLIRSACGGAYCEIIRLLYEPVSAARSNEEPASERAWEKAVVLYNRWSR